MPDAMAYILMVNAGMFSSIPGVTYGAIYIATAISAVIGLGMMMPAFCKPRNAMNRPMPAGIATRTACGIAWALLAIAIMSHRNVKGSVLLGIVGGTVLYYMLGFLQPSP